MDPQLLAIAKKFVLSCKYVTQIQNLRTKIRVRLIKEYYIDLYYNSTLQKYSYTLLKQDQRVLSFDNAPHHKNLPNFPHHFHTSNGKIISSSLHNSLDDIDIIVKEIESLLQSP